MYIIPIKCVVLLFGHKRFIHWESSTHLIHNVTNPNLYRRYDRHSWSSVVPTTCATTNIRFPAVIAFDPGEPMNRQSIAPNRVSLLGSHAETLLAGKHSDQFTLSLASNVSGSPMLSRSFAS